MANHLQPTITSTYANFVSEMDARFDDLAVGLDPAATTATNIPTNSIRWDSVSNKWQKYNGSTWGDLSSTFAINISGSSASAVNLSTNRSNWSTNGTITAVVGQLAWKNYGDAHTIFDASAGTAPDGSAISSIDSVNGWGNTYPTLMGWNGIETYGVRVDSSRVSGTATNQSGGTVAATSIGYSTTLTGGTGVVNLGSGQFYKDASGNIGIGTSSPAYKFQVASGIYGSVSTGLIDVNTTAHIYRGTPDTAGWHHSKVLSGRDTSAWTYGSYLAFYTEGKHSGTTDTSSEKMRLDSSGNLGLGVTPSAWGSSLKVIQVNARGAFFANSTNTFVANNYYDDGSSYRYIATAAATDYYQASGAHIWRTAPSGTAGAAVSFTQAMTLDASGNLLVGVTSALFSASNRGVINVGGSSGGLLALQSSTNTGYLFQNGADLLIENDTAAGNIIFGTNTSTERMRLDSSGNLFTANGKIGPNATQQHTMPAVASDTYTLNAATQTLTNKTLTDCTGNTQAAGTSDTKLATTAFVQAALQALYPVGSVYINASNSTSPATLFGFGTWAAFGAGRVPVGFDAADPLFDAAEEIGGSKDAIVVSHSHTASTESAGNHNHTLDVGQSAGSGTSALNCQDFGVSGSHINAAGDHTHAITVNSAGSSGTNANLQPYITVFMWKRTA